ncbi:MAG: DUF3244 domain-containing protein [Tannerellaceae bacterium]|nr:DUF3244 domain-containing protein [Tannerellaceae bacterium]
MKRVVVFTLILTALMTSTNLFADDALVVMAGWSKKDYRSSNPAGQNAAFEVLPAVAVENGVMLMSFTTEMSDLRVAVATAKGAIVYETMISAGGGITIPLRTGLRPGSYLLIMSHPRLGAMVNKLTVD